MGHARLASTGDFYCSCSGVARGEQGIDHLLVDWTCRTTFPDLSDAASSDPTACRITGVGSSTSQPSRSRQGLSDGAAAVPPICPFIDRPDRPWVPRVGDPYPSSARHSSMKGMLCPSSRYRLNSTKPRCCANDKPSAFEASTWVSIRRAPRLRASERTHSKY